MYKLRTSSSIIGFREKAEKIWKIERYQYPQDKYQKCVFFGLYHWRDYWHFIKHKGERFVLWSGGDIHNLKRQYLFSDGNRLWLSKLLSFIKWHRIFYYFPATHFVENQDEQDVLTSLGIKSFFAPSFLENVNDFQIKTKRYDRPQVFISVHPNREIEYGEGLVRQLANKFQNIDWHIYGKERPMEVVGNFNNIFWHGRVANSQFNEEIADYHCGFRPNIHDGCSEVMVKSILNGGYPLTRIKYPMVDNYESYDDLILFFSSLKEKIQHKNYQARNYWQNNLNKYPWTS